MQTESNNEPLYLGVDGGQSHTEALIADGSGRVVGRGVGGPSVSDDFTGGVQLETAVRDAIRDALKSDLIPEFKSAYFGLTGDFQEEKKKLIETFVRAGRLVVGHDAPSALLGAMTGRPGIIVISGTGSVVLGENESGEYARAGGLGYLFSDEGSGFWIGAQAIRLAILERDGVLENSGVGRMVCGHFGEDSIDDVALGFYTGRLTRDAIASLAEKVQQAVAAEESPLLEYHLDVGTRQLADKVRAVAGRLRMKGAVDVAGVGGMFRGKPFRSLFIKHLRTVMPEAEYCDPRFGPGAGALLMSYRQAGVEINQVLLDNLQESLR